MAWEQEAERLGVLISQVAGRFHVVPAVLIGHRVSLIGDNATLFFFLALAGIFAVDNPSCDLLYLDILVFLVL